jgi:antitoxin component of RelBE/YafQ-DinJ toxin-antitoxin module
MRKRTTKNSIINLRVTEAEKDNVQTMARERGITVSEYIRRVSKV